MKPRKKDKLNIVFVCDDSYFIPTGIAISSLYRNRDTERTYEIFVMADEISREHQQALREMSSDRFSVNILNAASLSSYDSFPRMKDASHVSSASLYKFDIPNALADIDKALYIDGDVIIRDSLTELYDRDVSKVYAAVCADMGAESWPSHYNKRLGISHESYFNSGVMLMNLKKMRLDAIPAKLLEYKIYGKNDYMDQDAFNVIFDEKVTYFSFLNNMAISCFCTARTEELCAFYNLKYKYKKELYRGAKILHFSSKEKPWLYFDVIGSEEWLFEFINSPLKRFELYRTKYSKTRIGDIDEAERLELWERRCITVADDPKVSVIIPVFNASEHLNGCIESLMCQTLTDAEYIFVDDGSSDSSVDILERYALLDSRIRIYRQKNQFAGVARNNGISRAKGEYITFLDSDDIMLPRALENFIKIAERDGADTVISSAYHFKSDPHHREVAAWCLRDGFISHDRGISVKNHSKYIFQITAGAPWGKMFKSSLIRRKSILFPAVPRAEDTYFVYLALVLSQSISILRDETVLYRNDTESGSLENTKDLHPTAQMKVKEMLYLRLCEEGMWECVRQSFINNLINTLAYHFRTFKTPEAFAELYLEFKDRTVPYYGIDMNDAQFFYVKGEYDYMKNLYDSKSCLAYFHGIAEVYKSQADRHWRALMSRNANSSALTVKNVDIPDREAYLFFTSEVYAIRRSVSYKLGRFMTWLPRKMRAFSRYSQKHGFLAAIRRSFWKIFPTKDGKSRRKR